MPLNDLIAQGGRGVASPIQRYMDTRKDMQAEQMNRLAMESTQQMMGINAQKQQMAIQEHQLKGMASVGKYITTLPEEQRESAFQSLKPQMAQQGLSPPPASATWSQVAPQVEVAMMQVYGQQEKFVDYNKDGIRGQQSTTTGKIEAYPKQSTDYSSASLKKMKELVTLGIDPTIAEGIAYGAYKISVDPTTGDVIKTDLRGQAPASTDNQSQTAVLLEGDRREQVFDKKVESFSKEIEKSSIVDVENAMRDVELMISDIQKNNPDADLPGYGATASLPDFAVSDRGKQLRQRVATLFNMTLKDRSGAAVTAPELTRLKNEFGSGVLKSDAQLLDAIQRFRGVVDKHKLSLAAGYDDDVVGTWQKRSNMTLRNVTRKDAVRLKINMGTGQLEPK